MEKLVVVFFTMNCGREGLCNMVAPEFEKLLQEYSGVIFRQDGHRCPVPRANF